MKAVQIYNFYIQTSQKNQGNLTDATINLPSVLTKKAKNSYFSVRCNGLTVPFSFHQLSSDINTVQVQFRDSSLNTKTTTISLQSGNYNCINVLEELKAKLVAECQISSPPFVGFIPSLTFSYSSTTNKSTFSLSGNSNIRIIIYFSQNTLLGKFFGFDTDLTITPSSSQTSLKTSIANPVHSIYLRSGNLKQLYNREWIVEKGVYSDVLYISPIFTQQNTYIQSNHQGDECILSDENIQDINLYISTNLNYNPIELNGLDFSCNLTISEVILNDYIPIEQTTFNNFISSTSSTSSTSDTFSLSQEGKEIKDDQEGILKSQEEDLINKLTIEKKRLEKKLKKYLDINKGKDE